MGMLTDELYYFAINVRSLLAHFVIKIRTIEGTFVFYRTLDAQALDNVRTDLLCGSGGECYNWCLTNLTDHVTDAAVFRSEIVAPFRDAMRFVDGVKRNPDGLQEF